jgi:hypothetical protein
MKAGLGGARQYLVLAIAAAIAGILFMAPAATAAVLWSPGGIAVCSNSSVQSAPVSCPDGAGGAITAWVDERYSAMTGKDIFAQRIDAGGNRVWASDVSVSRHTDDQVEPQIVADGAGGAIITWTDYVNSDADIYAQRIDSDGGVHGGWTAEGEQVSVFAAYTQAEPCICSDQQGGAVIAWRDYRNGNNDVYAQLIDGDGDRQWQNTAEPLLDEYDGIIVSDAILDQEHSRITWASGGTQPGPVIVWEDDRDNTTSNLDIYAQKLNPATGAGRWTADGTDVYEDSAGAQAQQEAPCLAGDGLGGAAFAWQDNRNGTYDIYAQRVNASGVKQWGTGATLVSGAANGQIEPCIAPRAAGGAIIAWHDMRSDLGDIYASALNTAGGAVWASPAVVCDTAGTQEVPVIAADGASGAVIAWTHLPSTSSDVYAQFIDASGDSVLTGGGVAVCDASNVQSSISIAYDASFSPILSWRDARTDADGDVYAQRITSAAPSVASISPGSAVTGSTVSVTDLAGADFDLTGATVKLKKSGETDIDATGVTVVSSSRITCTLSLGAAAAGTWDVYVRNASSGKSGTLADGFTVGAADTSYPVWYLAEGSTDWGYDTLIYMQNPNSSAVTADVDYQTRSGPRSRADITLPANSQTMLDPRGDIGDTDFSTRITCEQGKSIAVDRRMTWTGAGAASPEGHSSVGVTAPATTWYLPEGSSKWGFECWLLVQNPNPTAASCEVTYMIEGESARTVSRSVPANSRASFNMLDDIGEKDASIKVVSSVPVIPERAMYRYNRREGHDSIGTTSPATDYFLAEGTTNWGFTTYVLVQNPNPSAADVVVTYMTNAGPKVQPSFSMPANSRKTIRVNDVLPGQDLSTRVHADRPIIAERAMYWDNGTGEASHDSIGMSSAHQAFYLPDGQAGGGFETWTLVQNPNASAVSIEITYMTPSGTGNRTITDNVPAGSRKTYFMADAGLSSTASVKVVSKTAGRKIMVERAMYWNNRGAGTDTIGGFDD